MIADEGPLSQQCLGLRMRVDRTTIVSVVDDLEAAGFVHRKRNPDDRRAYALSRNTRGRGVARGQARGADGAHAELLAPLAPDEQDSSSTTSSGC